MKRYDARRYDGDYVLYSDVEKMEQAHREEIAALTARCELYLRINKVHLDTILELTARCKRLEKHQSVCECGGYSKDHTIGDGHYPVDIVQPCPFAERCKRLEEALGASLGALGLAADIVHKELDIIQPFLSVFLNHGEIITECMAKVKDALKAGKEGG